MRYLYVILVAVIVMSSSALSMAEEPYYKGKTIRMVVGFSAGGGFDTYSRVLARHMAKYIPGAPTIIIENMTGAGSLIAANHVYKVAKPDGLTIGHFIGGLFMGQVLGQKGIQFDARKYEFIGAPVRDQAVCALTRASGITSAEKWFASPSPVKMGGVAPGSSTPDNFTRILRSALGLPIQVVTGYKGTADVRLAADGGELAGGCWGWDSVAATWRKALDTGEVAVVLQTGRKPHPDLPNVPLAIKLAKSEEARQLIEVGIHDDSEILRSYTLPPGTPKDRVQLLRKAFMETLKDPQFLAEADKANLGVDPVSGDEIEKIIAGYFKLNPGFLAKLKEIIYG